MNPNSEQKIAIEHEGGVLLSAGAGSGKTYVIVEHIIYRLGLLKKKVSPELLNDEMKKFLSDFILMTFTKDATREMKVRLLKRVKSESETDPFYLDVLNEIDRLSITTIHGFCNNLIKMGCVPDCQFADDVLSDNRFDKMFLDIFDSWLSEQTDDYFIKYSRLFLNSFKNVLTQNELLRKWRRNDQNELSVIDFFEANNLSEDTLRLNISHLDELSDKKWYELIRGVNEIVSKDKDDWPSLLAGHFLKMKGTRKPTKKANLPIVSDHVDFLMKTIRPLISEMVQCLNFISTIDPQVYKTKINSFFKHYERLRHRYQGITYNEMELVVYNSLINNTFLHDNMSFSYFVVDEFQDTSEIQFEIINRLLRGNLNSLFCVGDLQQAIYGFRGGDVEVFQKVKKMIPQYLELKNNYRSSKEVIEFNNHFFTSIFPVGRGYTGEDDFQIEAISQRPGLEIDGSINIYTKELDSEKKISAADLDSLEATGICEILQDLSSKEKEACVLYRRLAPSRYLINQLIENKVSFTAQYKTPLSDNPIINIFYHFVQGLRDEDFNICHAILKEIFSSLNLDLLTFKANDLKENLKYFSLYDTFLSFLALNKLSVSMTDESLSYIRDLCVISSSLDEVSYSLKQKQSDSASIHLRFGDKPDSIQIMSVHKSKGLEFEHVIIGGLYTSAASRNDSFLLGHKPTSFQIPADDNDSFAMSLDYLDEKKKVKKKDFSESKRLLYVSCTRAVSSLSFVKLAGHDFSKSKDDWAHAVFSAANESFFEVKKSEKVIDNLSSKKKPFYHIDRSSYFLNNHQQTLVLPELSVSRLSSFAECPRKFYLENYASLDQDFLNKLNLSNENIVGISSKERGVKIHYEIEMAISKNNFNRIKDEETRSFIKENIPVDKELKTEHEIKFPFISMTLNAFLDLLVLKEGQVAEIWDFKTGLINSSTLLDKYIFQLKMYAYACHINNLPFNNGEVRLVICHVDEKKLTEIVVKQATLSDFAQSTWKQLNNFNAINEGYCRNCLFDNFCHPSST